MSSSEPKRKSPMARKRAEYVARRDADADRSIYKRLPPDNSTASRPGSETTSDLPIWPSAQKGGVTSQYQRHQPEPPSVFRTVTGRLIIGIAIVCPVAVLIWVAFELLDS